MGAAHMMTTDGIPRNRGASGGASKTTDIYLEEAPMRTKLMIALGVVACSVCIAVWPDATPVVASDEPAILAGGAAAAALNAGEETKFTYVGSKACKKCHIKQYKSWKKTKMAKGLEILKPGQAKEAKEKYKLDPAKDYSTDKSCLKCHTTGYGEPGGYAIPDPKDADAVKKAKNLEGVGCESCHGPGSAYAKVFKEIQKSKREYKQEELYKVGLKKMGKESCVNCHNDKSPTYDKSKPFDYEKQKDADTHEHLPLKLQEK